MHALLPIALLASALVPGAAPPARPTPADKGLEREAGTLFARAHSEHRAGKVTDALASMAGALAVARRGQGELAWPVLAASSWLANWEEGRDGWEEAAAHRERVLRIASGLFGEGHWKAVDARISLAHARAQATRTPAQREAVRRAKGLAAEANELLLKGQDARAIPPAKQAVKLLRGALGPAHADYGAALSVLAKLLSRTGDHDSALPLYREALGLAREAFGLRHPDHVICLFNLAELLQDMGDHQAALPFLREELALRRALSGHGHHDTVWAMRRLAGLHLALGEYGAALPLAREALKFCEAGPERNLHVESLINLAMMLTATGDFKAALPLSRKALKLARDTLGRRHPLYARCLHHLASLHLLGDAKEALPYCEESRRLTEGVKSLRPLDHAQSLEVLASLRLHLGDHEAALPLIREALELTEKAVGRRHPNYAAVLNNHAAALWRMGDAKAALPVLRESLAVIEGTSGRRHPVYSAALKNQAGLLLALGDPGAALPLAEKAAALLADHLRRNASTQSDRQQLDSADALRHVLDLRLSFPDTGGYPHLLAWKGAVMLRQRQARLFARLSADPATRKLADDLQATTRRIAALAASPTPPREAAERLTSEQERLQAELFRRSAAAREAREKEAPSPKALADALPEDAALIDYLVLRHHGLPDKDGKTDGPRRLIAFVTRRNKPPARVDLGEAGRIEEAVQRWRALLAGIKPEREAGRRVKDLVLAPLEGHLGGVKLLLVSPDGALGTVPFAALPGKKEGYLIEDVAIAVVPVPAALPELTVRPEGRHPASLLVVSDVDYDAVSHPRDARGGRRSAPSGPGGWARLDAAGAEGASVGKSFRALFAGHSPFDLARTGATKAAVREALPRVRYAHLATHGFFAPEEVKSAAGHAGPAGLARQAVTGWHPLLLSGLVLAGANRGGRAGEEDGILTALEVSEMDLSKLELAVLSACETGLGREAGGEGLLGLQRAFAVAGARTVVASLWNVDDFATKALMSDFYSIAWDAKAPAGAADALRQAQLALLAGKTLDGKPRGVGKIAAVLPKGGRLHPYYWAPFVLSGGWR